MEQTEQENTKIQKLSENGGNSLTTRKNDLLRLAGIINKIRVVQGWNLLGPTETAPLASVWAHELDRHHVPPELYDEMLSRAIDHRLWFLRKSEDPPALTVELIIMMYERYWQEQQNGKSS